MLRTVYLLSSPPLWTHVLRMQHVTRLVDGGIGRRVAEGKAEEQGERGSVQHHLGL